MPNPAAHRAAPARAVALALAAAMLVPAASPAWAEPPPWAPAYGYRAKKKQERVPVYVLPQPVFYTLPAGIPEGRCDRGLLSGQMAGGLLGGALGGLAGSQIGDGNGRTAAVIGGVLIGMLVGQAVGSQMDTVDQACVAQALEHAPTDRTISWRNPDAGAEYSVTPVRTIETSGRQCREYLTTVTVDGRAETAYGTACRQPDGSWQKVG